MLLITERFILFPDWDAFAQDCDESLATALQLRLGLRPHALLSPSATPRPRSRRQRKAQRLRVVDGLQALTHSILTAASKHIPRGQRRGGKLLWTDLCEIAYHAYQPVC